MNTRVRFVVALFTIGTLLSLARPGTARADGDDDQDTDDGVVTGSQVIHPGVQTPPPGPAAPESAPLEMDPGGRRAVRGCQVSGEDCGGDLTAGLRQFEHEAFPRPGTGSPWTDSGDAAARPHPARGRRELGPTELRPDLPWLRGLEMPDLPVHWDGRIIRYLEFYRDDPRGHQLMAEWLKAQGRYRDMILDTLRAHHLPDDLLYVCMIESSYDPLDRSRVGASGLWQFMPSGGAIYGLHRTHWLDQRNDPVQATRAVTAYFADLYQRFGDWDLALTAFNAGYGAVLRAIAKYNTNDFWQLLDYENALPWASSIYVPKILAAAIVGHNRARFGFANVVPAPPARWDTVTVPTSVSLSILARAAGTDEHTLEELNPALRHKRTPPGVKGFMVRIPAGRRAQFGRRFAQLRGDWDTCDAYVVRHGERFEDIATTYGLSPRKLRELNGLDSEREVEGGMLLVVPRVTAAERQANRQKAQESLYAAGEPKGDPGDKLVVAVPDPAFKVAGRDRVFYRVVVGDSLTRVAQVFGVDRHDLAAWNGLDPEALLHPRMVLEVWVQPGFDARKAKVSLLDPARLEVVKAGLIEHIEADEKLMGRERVVYKAAHRESYEQIGKHFGLNSRDLARINRKPFDTVLQPGESCVVYKVVDKKASARAAEQARQAAPRRSRARHSRPSGRAHHH